MNLQFKYKQFIILDIQINLYYGELPMKKITLALATATLITSSTAFATMEDSFYLKTIIGANKLNGATDPSTTLKMDSKPTMFLALGAGYNITDSARVDVTLDHFFSPKLSKTDNAKFGSTIKKAVAEHKADISSLMINGYFDLFDISITKIFVGAGFGLAHVKEQVIRTIGTDKTRSDSIKGAFNFAYQVSIGGEKELSNGITAEVAYSFRDFGKTDRLTTKYGNKIGNTPYKGHHIGFGLRFDI